MKNKKTTKKKITKIKSKILSAEVVKDIKQSNTVTHITEVIHEKLERPDHLIGSTYKVKTPMSEHALYITINDILLNKDTEHQKRVPFEIFINCKSMDHFQWIVALTRIISAVFRKGGDVTFLVEELNSVFDPKGGYFKKGGKYMPSIVAEIGEAIREHLIILGLIKIEELDEHQKQLIEDKKAEYNKQNTEETNSEFPKSATICDKCGIKAVILMDNCKCCLNCASSNCG